MDDTQVLDYEPPQKKPPRMWPIRLVGLLGVFYCPVKAVLLLRNPDVHEKALQVSGLAIAFAFSVFNLFVKPRKDDESLGANERSTPPVDDRAGEEARRAANVS